MTEVQGLDRFLGHVRKFGPNLQVANYRAVGQASLAVKAAVISQMGGVTRLSGVGKNGAKVGVRYDLKGRQNPTSLVRATGPFHLLERDTKAHVIPKRRGKSNRLRLGDDWVTGPIEHPGTKGKYPWLKGTTAARPITREVFRREFRRTMKATFGG